MPRISADLRGGENFVVRPLWRAELVDLRRLNPPPVPMLGGGMRPAAAAGWR
jgi:hypothetical protein